MYFYPNYIALCNKFGKSPSTVAQELGFSNSVTTRWKHSFESGKGEPTYKTLEKIAGYFGVEVKELTKAPDTMPEKELSQEETQLIRAWRRANTEQKENIAFILRNYGFKYEQKRAEEKVG